MSFYTGVLWRGIHPKSPEHIQPTILCSPLKFVPSPPLFKCHSFVEETGSFVNRTRISSGIIIEINKIQFKDIFKQVKWPKKKKKKKWHSPGKTPPISVLMFFSRFPSTSVLVTLAHLVIHSPLHPSDTSPGAWKNRRRMSSCGAGEGWTEV